MSEDRVIVWLAPKYLHAKDAKDAFNLEIERMKYSVECESLSIDDALQYMKRVSEQAPVDHYCVKNLSFDFETSMYIEDDFKANTLQIYVHSKGYCSCVRSLLKQGKNNEARGRCIENIAKGRCKDPSVIKHIGKVFFPEKYIKGENQR